MTTEPKDERLSILRRLWEELEADVALANNLLDVLTCYLEQMRSRDPEVMRVESNELIRSIAKKEEFIMVYRAM
nr:hypothetical protein [Tanacetum cinerariifolium]